MNYKHLIFIIFSIAIIIFVFWSSKSKFIEPLENQTESQENVSQNNCCGNDPLFLAIKNASEIAVLKDQVKEISILKQQLNTLQSESEDNKKVADEIQQQFSSDANALQSSMETPENEDMNESGETEVQPEMSETMLSPEESGPGPEPSTLEQLF